MVMAFIVFVTFVYMFAIKWLMETTKLDDQQHDILTITPSDFTVELDITDKMREHFETCYIKEGQFKTDTCGHPFSKALYLKKLLVSKVEEVICLTKEEKEKNLPPI